MDTESHSESSSISPVLKNVRIPFLGAMVAWFFCSLTLPSCAAVPELDPELAGQPQIMSVIADEVIGGGNWRFPFSIRYVEEPIVKRETFPSPPTDVFPALVRAFGQEGLDPDWIDPERRVVGLTQFTMERRRGGRPLSAFLDCGSTTTGRPMANDSRIVAGVVSQVVEAGADGSTVLVRFEAHAQPFGASEGRAQSCTTTGQLEQSIFLRIRFR